MFIFINKNRDIEKHIEFKYYIRVMNLNIYINFSLNFKKFIHHRFREFFIFFDDNFHFSH